jgi:hypothetical protein
MSQADNGWIGVDLDRTLAVYESGQYPLIGAPIPLMVERVKKWLAAGIEVRIVTARASTEFLSEEEVDDQVELIQTWCIEHIGALLEVQSEKDFNMISLWDDRAVQVEPNTGKLLGVDLNE